MAPAALDALPAREEARPWIERHARSVTGIVVAITVLALLARLVFLGDRIAHWDEARVAYWIVHYQETGSFAYRRIIHGPFIQHVNRWLFPILGANDFTMRLPVALVGGLLPASALLFRKHLRDSEVVAMAAILAINPVVLYYSRFMRSDVLVAAFMFVGFGLLVRYYDTRKYRYLGGAAAFAAMGFASKENAAVYILTWIGAAALLADVALYRPRGADSGWALLWGKVEALRTEDATLDRSATEGSLLSRDNETLGWYALGFGGLYVLAIAVALNLESVWGGFVASTLGLDGIVHIGWVPGILVTLGGAALLAVLTVGVLGLFDVRADAVERLLRTGYAMAGAGVLFFALLLFFYAPRGAGMEGLRAGPVDPAKAPVPFWEGVAALLTLDLGTFLAMVDGAWVHVMAEFGQWFGQAGNSGPGQSIVAEYVEYLGRFVRVMLVDAIGVTVFAVFGALLERYGARSSRNLVMFSAYAGFVSVLGYPLGTDVFGAWIVVHAVVPLAIPAAVGVGRVYRWGQSAFLDEAAISTFVSAAVLFLVLAQVLTVAVGGVYVDDQSGDNPLVQYAQPADDPRAEMDAMHRIASEDREGPDVVVYYGPRGDATREPEGVADDPYDENAGLVRAERNWDNRHLDFKPHCVTWFNALPLPWYFAATDADVDCERDATDLEDRITGSNPPPMIITIPTDPTIPRPTLNDHYVSRTHEMRTFGTQMTFWVRPEYATWESGPNVEATR